jgi:hypothetical protein
MKEGLAFLQHPKERDMFGLGNCHILNKDNFLEEINFLLWILKKIYSINKKQDAT